MTSADNGNGDPQREAEIDGVRDALRGRDPDQYSAEFNAQADAIVELIAQGRRDFAFELYLASPVIQREAPASEEEEWGEDEEFADLEALDDEEEDDEL